MRKQPHGREYERGEYMDFIDKYLKKNNDLLSWKNSLYRSTGREDSVILTDCGAEVVFPVENPYLMQELLKGFEAEGKSYDFTAYDHSLLNTWLDPRRVEMILMRLKYPVDLPEEEQEVLRGRISGKLPEVLSRVAKSRNMRVLQLLCELDFFTKENVDSGVELLGAAGEREMMVALMNWKNRTFGSTEFDFDL